ncbi:MAG: hypothetical protein HC785_30695 [Calothrix sp. CSU_2_0]|nr:hypothetical protein [Calothrix sp. CSU_2_0]
MAKTLASASWDKTVKLWNISTGQEITTLNHENEVNNVVFSSSDKTLAAASIDNTINLWSLDIDDLLTQGCNYLKDYLVSRSELRQQVCPNK